MSIPPPAIQSEDIDLSKFSLENLHEMRITFPGYKDEDYARFLIARNNRLNDAKELFQNHLNWKETTPKPTKSSCLNLLQRKFLFLHGYDLEGHPLLVAKMARHDPYNRDLEEMNRQLLWWLDHIFAAMPENKSKYTVFIDRTGATAANQDIELCKSFAAIFQNNFPERLYRIVIYPSGLVFYGMWNVVQWFLDPVTRQKVCPVMYQSGVLQYIDPSFVSHEAGGTSTYEPDIDSMEDAPPFIHYSPDQDVKKQEQKQEEKEEKE